MGTKLQPDQMELYRRVDEVLTYVWDPIGVAGVPEARDEYYGYLPKVFNMVLQGKPKDEIADYLVQIETESMGFDNSKNSRKNALEIAELLIDHYDWIKQKN